jgi:hypothetical protein
MGSIAHHVTLRLQDDWVLAPSPAARRRGAAAILRFSKLGELVAFGLADNHVHLLMACDRPTAGNVAHRTMLALRSALGIAAHFAPARIRPVTDHRHLANACRYVLRQHAHHGLTLDPLSEATSLPDLLGLRLVASDLRSRVRELLPRLRIDELVDEAAPDLRSLLTLSTMAQPSTPSSDDLLLLAEGAAATFALPELTGITGRAMSARHAAVHVVDTAASGLRLPLRCAARTIQALRRRPAPGDALRAVRLSWTLRLADAQCRAPTEERPS